MDHFRDVAYSGYPLITHTRASNVWANLRKESPGYSENETLWEFVDNVVLTGTTYAECYKQLAEALSICDGGYKSYWKTLSKAMIIWADLF